MSWTVIFGSIFATFLTLVIVPAMYLLMTRMKYKIGGVRPVVISENGSVLTPHRRVESHVVRKGGPGIA